MLLLESLDISSYVIGNLNVTWQFKPTIELLAEYQLSIYRSEAPGVSSIDGYDLIASGISAIEYSYTDAGVAGLYDPLRTWYYKVKLENTTTGEVDIQPDRPAYRKGTTADKYAIEVIRRKSLSLDRFAGRDYYVLKRRTYGTHCPLCWDTQLQRIDNSGCTTCYDTGWTSGYFTAIYTKGMMTSAPKYNQITMFGEWVAQDTLFTMLGFPPLRAKDVVVDDTNKRWIIKQVQNVEKGGYVIEQVAQCSLIALDDVVYDIDNDIGILSALPVVSIEPATASKYAHFVTKDYLEDKLLYKPEIIFFQKFFGTERNANSYGSKFIVTEGIGSYAQLANGSIQVTINGVHYLSNTDQTSMSNNPDFHFSGTEVIVRDLANNGTINIIDGDVIGIYYQLENTL